jgi:hypothetical protein
MGKKRALLRKNTSKSSSDDKPKKKSRSSQEVSENDHDSSSESESENEEISLVHKESDLLEEFTFEFYDMRESYVESIMSLCKGIFINPTRAYEAATAIVGQGMRSSLSRLYA